MSRRDKGVERVDTQLSKAVEVTCRVDMLPILPPLASKGMNRVLT